MPIRQTRGIPTREGVTVVRRPPRAPGFERSDTPRDGGLTRQRAPIGNSLNDEQRSDDLPDPSSHETVYPKVVVMGKC